MSSTKALGLLVLGLGWHSATLGLGQLSPEPWSLFPLFLRPSGWVNLELCPWVWSNPAPNLGALIHKYVPWNSKSKLSEENLSEEKKLTEEPIQILKCPPPGGA